MRKSLRAVLVATVVSAGLFGTQALMAHQDSGGTMGMMGQMGQMMDGCNRMMQEHQHNGDAQRPVRTPTEEGEKQGSGAIMGMMRRMNVMRPMSQMMDSWK